MGGIRLKCDSMDTLLEMYRQGTPIKYVFFWGHRPESDGRITESCLSQWWNCSFQVKNRTYHTAEQYMMAQKALLFKDEKIFKRIMEADHPGEYKRLGREIVNFSDKIWKQHRMRIVVEGNCAKFSQNPELKAYLLSTKDRVLVEASPHDRIWGIGMSKSNPQIENPTAWKGLNCLGFALMQTRDLIAQSDEIV